jgi:transmembrane 9 superfamily member 2/4
MGGTPPRQSARRRLRGALLARRLTFAVALAVAACAQTAAASFLSGLTATDYPAGAPLNILAHSLFSARRIPYDYFSLPFCPAPAEAGQRAAASGADTVSLGQILLGERAHLTAFDLRMRRDVACATACTATFDATALTTLARHVRFGYRARLTLDGMPAVVREPSGVHYELGHALGYTSAPDGLVARAAAMNAVRALRDGMGAGLTHAASSGGGGGPGGGGLKIPTVIRSLLARHALTGALRRSKHYVYNHLDFTVLYHVPDDLESVAGRGALSDGNSYRVVGFEVIPRSAQYPLSNPPAGSDPASHCVSAADTPAGVQEPMEITFGAHSGADADVDAGDAADAPGAARRGGSGDDSVAPRDIKFTYSVRFVESSVAWVTRFDTLLKVSRGRSKIQWFAIVNSMMLAVFLSAVFAAVLLRTLRRDCARYGFSAARNDGVLDDFNDDFENDSGWRMLRGDVFRPPPAGSLLCILCGSGSQLTLVMFVTLVAAVLGLISPGRRGQLVTCLVVLYALSSCVAGYVAASMHRAIGGSRWRLVTFGVAVVLPGVAFSTFLVVNVFLWAMGSIGAAPFTTLFLLLFLWLGVSVPLAFAGTYFGYIRKVYDFPVRTNQIPRQIPPQARHLSSPYLLLAAGAIPFGMVGIELRLILRSIMQQEIYHMFAFLLAISALLAVTCAEVSVVLCYVRLANEDWAWWWPSFWASGSSGLYVFAFSLYTLATSAGVEPGHIVSSVLFVAYSALFSFGFTLLTGSIGCLSALAFVRRIFSVSSDD